MNTEKGRPWKRWNEVVKALKFPVPTTRGEEDIQYRRR
jgi:hypothetical protein